MNSSFKIAVAGEIYVDHIFTEFSHVPLPGEEVFAKGYNRDAGGGTVNTACALSLLGHQTALFGVLGQDEENWLRARLASFGVDTAHAGLSELPNALTISMSTSSDRGFLSYAGANELLDTYIAAQATLASLAQFRHVHLALPVEAKMCSEVLLPLKAAGCSLSMDAGWRKSWLMDPASIEVLRLMDVFLPNEMEAQLLTGETTPERMLQCCRDMGLSQTVLKLGAKGAAMLQGNHIYFAAPPQVRPVDTTGAGDAFDAGFIDAWLSGAEIEQQLNRACICGALSTRAAGGLAGLPSRRELEEFEQQREVR